MPTKTRVYHAKDGPRTYTHRYDMVTVAVTPRVKERLRARAKREGKTMAQLVRTLVVRGLAEA